MIASVNSEDIHTLAKKLGFGIQHDCGGYRVIKTKDMNSNSYVFPDSGICPTASRKECWIFMKGVEYARGQ